MTDTDMTDTESSVIFTSTGHVAVITINRPAARNAVNAAVALGVEAAVDRLESDPNLRVGVITGVPPVFSAGADLKEINAGRRQLLRTERGGFAGFVARKRIKPVIAAVDGPALAGGMEICLACDLIVASEDARFGIPEVKRSLVPAAGGLFRLPRKIPINIAMEMTLTGEPMGARRASRLGLVNELVESGQALARALELASRVAANAPIAVQASRRVILASHMGDESTAWELSADAMAEAMSSEDMKEGLAAFLEKRSPIWTGR
jgi:enoyl-CoA hydratase